MRIVAWVGLAVFVSLGLRASTCFYDVDFNHDRLNEPPPTDVGTNNPTGPLSGTPTVVHFFEQLTNQPLLLSGPQYEGVGFQLARGVPDYAVDFDFEAHDLRTSGDFTISFWGTLFELAGDGGVWAPDGHYYQLGWNDDEVHHLHTAVSVDNVTNVSWTIQLDNNEPIIGPYNYNGDVISVFLALQPLDTNVQVAIDNIVVGTTSNFVPLRPLLSLSKRTGFQPHGGLARDSAGNLYGTTTMGGRDSFNGPGTVFKINRNGDLVWCFSFDGENGAQPEAGVIIGDDGFLYGTTAYGGAHGQGTIFKMSQNGELIWSASLDGENGSQPSTELTQVRGLGRENEIYGTTLSGGIYGKGTVFKFGMSRTVQVLHSFTGGADGAQPLCRLCSGDDGFLYGTTCSSKGTIFKIDSAGKFKTIFSFDGTNGSSPRAGLTKCGTDFYGTTEGGGTNDTGTAFRITSSGDLLTLCSFGQFGTLNDSQYPESELVLGRDGNLYGTTPVGGSGNIFTEFGTVFRISPIGALQKLADFHGGDGSFPMAGLIEGEPGQFYGTTAGGYFSGGNVFCISAMRPVILINRSLASQVSGGELQITGKTKCDPPVTNVIYRVNGGAWVEASSTNDWSRWIGTAIPTFGMNSIQAYAISAFGDVSWTNTLKFRW